MALDLDLDPDTVTGSIPLVLGCGLTVVAVINYLQGANGGAVVASLGAIVTFLLVVFSRNE